MSVQPIHFWRAVQGPFIVQDGNFLQHFCRKIKNGTVVELGALYGKSTIAMALVLKENGSRLFTIDNFSGNEEGDKATETQRRESTFEQLMFNLSRFEVDDVVTVMRGDSAGSADQFEDGSVDLCFIDADHRPEAVHSDIKAWWPKIKAPGILCGHDYWSRPKEVVDEFVSAYDLELILGGLCWAVRKEAE